MRRRVAAIILGACVAGPSFAQPPAAPEVLPPTILEPVNPKPLSPAEAARQREATIAALKEDLVRFDPMAVTVKQADGRWRVEAGKVVLKEFGSDRNLAVEAARLIKDLGVTQMGRVPGSNPPFEYWLADGKAPRVVNGRVVVLPVTARSIHAEQVGGTWVVTDGAKGIYDFGPDVDACRRAATVCWKYGFNQLALVGEPRPAMFVPLTDPRQAKVESATPVVLTSGLGVLNDVSKTSLLLPGNVYAGPKRAIDVYKLEVVRKEHGEVVLASGAEVLARFGGQELPARSALRALQDGRATEVARIGSTGFPLFLASGQPIHGEPLGATRMSIRPDRVKSQKIRETWWVVEDSRPLFEAGTKEDAELMIQVLRTFDLKTLCLFGRAEAGGLRLLTTGR
jgi:hypothetical protein